jgi:HAMP domain-containing protein
MKTTNTVTVIDRVAMQASLVAARMCHDAVTTDDQVLLYRATERLKSAVQAVCKGHPSHSRLARTATGLLQRWISFCIAHGLYRGMASELKPTDVKLQKDSVTSKEFGAFVRALERSTSC